MMIDTAMVLAAGFGTRMKGVIDHPKAMITLDGRTLIDYILNNLYENGIKRVIINLNYKGELLEKHIASLDVYKKLEIIFSKENEKLETAGGVKNALKAIDREEFFIVNTDVFWLAKSKHAIQILLENWIPEKMEQLLLLLPKEKAFGYRSNGDFNLGPDMEILRKNCSMDNIYIGMNIVKRSFFDNLSDGKLGFAEIWQNRTEENSIVKGLYGAIFDGKWLHIGDPESKYESEKYFQTIKTDGVI